MSRFATLAAFEAALADMPIADADAIAAARARQTSLTKP
ncbi:MAG: nicotinate-nucleotide--dimethylbenzimidazole phosphoribosyltransferase, partial [Sphingobium sp.]|nr:nicotinate-nucleotide--dimethylbenzimidazole phosphoribosyltransferase [Sphingobium sp.]